MDYGLAKPPMEAPRKKEKLDLDISEPKSTMDSSSPYEEMPTLEDLKKLEEIQKLTQQEIEQIKIALETKEQEKKKEAEAKAAREAEARVLFHPSFEGVMKPETFAKAVPPTAHPKTAAPATASQQPANPYGMYMMP